MSTPPSPLATNKNRDPSEAANLAKGPRSVGSAWVGIGLVWELGWIIAIPVIILGFGGAYLDKRWGTAPWLLLGGFAISFLLSLAAAIHRIREYIRSTNASQ